MHYQLADHTEPWHTDAPENFVLHSGYCGRMDDFVDRDLRREGPVFAELRTATGYDRALGYDYTHGAQAFKTQGGPGFHNLRQQID